MNRRSWMRHGAAGVLAASFPHLFRVEWRSGLSSTGEIRLTTNENPYGPPESARSAVAEAIPLANRYPGYRISYADVKALIAEREGVTPAHVLLGNGSDEILCMAAALFGSRGRIVLSEPTYGTVARYAERIGGKVRRIPLRRDFSHDMDALAGAARSGASCVYLCNPNNPTGNVTSGDHVRALADRLPEQTCLLVDEAYHEYVMDDAYRSAVRLVRDHRNVVVTRTFSKIYGLAGLRVGYAVAPPARIDELRMRRMGMINVLGLRAASAAIEDAEFVEQCRIRNAEARRLVTETFDQLDVPYVRSEANFLYFRVHRDQRDMPGRMASRGVRFRHADVLDSDWARVTIGTMEEMERFCALARELMV